MPQEVPEWLRLRLKIQKGEEVTTGAFIPGNGGPGGKGNGIKPGMSFHEGERPEAPQFVPQNFQSK
ncbi:MAG TPA: hypothetical protein DCM73_03890 [Clostridiales bacterium]|nr:hypothetical protein [Clostridiales bacterium]